MPSYEYDCISCNIKVTLERSIHDEATPVCCGYPMRRVYNPVGAIFRGTGWGKDAR